MGAILVHPLTIAIIGGVIAIGIALYNGWHNKNLMYAQMRVEAKVKSNGVIAGKVDEEDCGRRRAKIDGRLDRGDEEFKKIERALTAIYVKQGGTPQELGL